MMRWSKRKLWICCLFSFIAIVMLASEINSATLLELDAKLRYRVNEVDTATSIFDTTTSFAWLNMAQDRIAVLAGYFPRTQTFTLSNKDTVRVRLLSDFRKMVSVFIESDNRFYPVFPNPGFLIDTNVMQYSVVWKSEDSAFLYLRRGGFQEVQTDIIFDADSTTYTLPHDFRDLRGVLVWVEQWEPVMPSPLFLKDVGTRQFDIHTKDRDTTLLYLRGTFQDGDTVRVFYRKSLLGDEVLTIGYLSIPTDMADGDTECEVPDDLEEFVVEEAIGYYFLYEKDKTAAQAIWEQVRIDMGVLKPGGQQ